MADQPSIYLAKIEGEEGVKLFRSTDPRLVRRHILDNLPKPEIEVRRPSTEEAMEAALDGVPIVDLTKKDAPSEPDLLTREEGDAGAGQPLAARVNALDDGSGAASGENPNADDAPRLAPGEHIDPETGEIVDDDPFGPENS